MLRGLVCLGLAFAGFHLMAQTGGWYNPSWSYSKAITINYTNVSANLTNFPILISLADNDLRNHAVTNGYDIVFTAADGTNKLSHEIESYNSSNGTLVAWVRVPILSSTTNTLLFLYYGNTAASNQQLAAAVWDTNFSAVWHLGESGAGVVGEYKDSTANGRNAQGMGGIPKQATGKIGTGQSFNGASAYIQSGTNVGITGNAVRTVSFWASLNTSTIVPFAGWGSSGNNALFMPGAYSGSLTLAGSGTGNDWTGIAAAQTGIWVFHSITYDGTTVRWYVNGVQAGSGFAHTYATTNGPMLMGYSTYSGVYYLNGSLDEVRVSNVARPLAWILTEFTNENSPAAFSTAGTQVEAPAASLVVTSVNGGASPVAGTAFSVVVQAQTAAGMPQNATNDTTVALSLYAGSGSLGGMLTGTITAGASSVTVTGVTYLKAEGGVEVMAAATRGDALIAGNSAPFTVASGAFTKLQLLMPGETAAPGSGTGKTGTAAAETAGTAFNVTVNAVDANWNLIGTNDTVSITSGDSNATLPASAALVTGTKTFSVTFKTVGARTVTASDETNGGITNNTSPATTVNAGPFKKLQVLMPGETPAPGGGTGKTGTPAAETAGTGFNVIVNAVDANWNLTSTNDTVSITTSDPNATPPASAGLVAGTKIFNVTLKTAGARTVTANDATNAGILNNTSPSIIVNAGPLQHFAFAAVGTQTYASPFNVSMSAQDTNNNTATNFSGTVTLTTTAGTISPAVSGVFVSGVLTQSVTVTLAGSGQTVAATRTGGSETGASGTFTVNQVPLTVMANNTNQVYGGANLGFTAKYTGFVNGDTAGVVQGNPGFTTSATTNSVVGTYAITPYLGNLAATNYGFITFSNGTLTITAAGATNVVSASANPSPTGSNVTFTATLTAISPGSGKPTGTVQFLADGTPLGASVPLAGGIAWLVTNSLTHGTHSLAAQYAGDGNFIGSTNSLSPNELIDSAPITASFTLQRYPTTGAKARLATLLANDNDPDVDPMIFSWANPASAQGGLVVTNFGWLFYTRPAGFTNTDSFVYVITDGSLQATGSVAVAIVPDTNFSQSIELSTNLGSGSTRTSFFGIPGRTYTIQYTTNQVSPTWQALGTATTDATGLLQYTDSPGTNVPPRAYRSTYP